MADFADCVFSSLVGLTVGIVITVFLTSNFKEDVIGDGYLNPCMSAGSTKRHCYEEALKEIDARGEYVPRPVGGVKDAP